MIIALKGLIGSGKTTASEYLQSKYQARHYNCDERVKYHYKHTQEVIDAVTNEVLKQPAKVIDLAKLRKVAFSNPQKLAKLEAIIYPYIQAEIENLKSDNKIVVLDCQQIDKIDIAIDYQICIEISEQATIKRVVRRDDRSVSQIIDILNIQKQQKNENINFTINNDGQVSELYQKLDQVMEVICKNK